MPKIHCYLRASTDGQHLSYRAQAEALKPLLAAWIKEPGNELGEVFCDKAVSGKSKLFDRPAGKKLLLALRPGDKLVFAKLDRGFRSLLDYASVVEILRGLSVSWACADIGLDSSTPHGQFVYATLAAFAQLERNLISIRTKEGLAARHVFQMPNHRHPPPGWMLLPGRKVLDCDPTERKLVRWIARQRNKGLSCYRIQRFIKHLGLKRANGSPYSFRFVVMALIAIKHKFPTDWHSNPALAREYEHEAAARKQRTAPKPQAVPEMR